jgi:regulator of protease activity HflC (stomatin/prohibitin superfamily)
MQLVKQGQYGISNNNGEYEIVLPGRHVLASPLNSYIKTVSQGDDRIVEGPINIIRVNDGQVGVGWNDGKPELLLPGRHVRNSASYKFMNVYSLTQDTIQFGPIKIVTVKTGYVRVCYDQGRVIVFPEGRYGINSNTFQLGNLVNTQQQNVRFSGHPVLLDGGIGMLVEGLLTYQIEDVEKLTREIGEVDVLRSIEDITKAELSRVFASVHLEQLATPSSANSDQKQERGLLGKQESVSIGEGGSGGCRTAICHEVIEYVSPICTTWGVRIINFQLESTKIADMAYAREYEECSLGLAKAQANRRAVAAQNDILLQKSQAKSNALQIEAKGRADALIIEARGNAEARIIESKSRNDAAVSMTDPFSKKLQLSSLQVDMAKGLQAKVLSIGANAVPMLTSIGLEELEKAAN